MILAMKKSYILHTFNSLSDDYKELKDALEARASLILFEELIEKLLNYESSLNHPNPIKVDTLVLLNI